MAAFGVVAALNARERTGEGQEVLTSLANQSVLTLSGELTSYEGRPPNPKGGLDLLGTGAMNRFYACSDGWIMLAGREPEHFPSTCVAVGHPEWAGSMVAEKAMLEPVESMIATRFEEAFAAMSKDEAIDRLLTRKVPAAPVTQAADIFEHPWFHASDYFDDFDHPQLGPIRGPKYLGTFEDTPGGYPFRSPLIGEHTVELLRECGFDDERIESLLAAGAIAQG
jgi:crotonobetainyl-CoA:carnitine CoA-transferase CaiB-like acyl-CoA transferase